MCVEVRGSLDRKRLIGNLWYLPLRRYHMSNPLQDGLRPVGGRYEVHWVVLVQDGEAEAYGLAIRRSWWTARGEPGERRLIVDFLGDSVTVVLEVVADDAWGAIHTTHPLIIGPVERSGLPLPERVTVSVGPRSRRAT
jgi:hypothetical protein